MTAARRFALGLILSLFLPTAAWANTRYVDDTLYLGFYKSADGSGGQFTSAPSGTKLTLIETRGDFSLVRTEKGTEGWVKTKYLVEAPPAVVRIKTLEKSAERADALVAEIELLQEENNYLRMELDAALLQGAASVAQANGDAGEGESPAPLVPSPDSRRVAQLEQTIQRVMQALNVAVETPHTEPTDDGSTEIQVIESVNADVIKKPDIIGNITDADPSVAWDVVLSLLKQTSVVHYVLIFGACLLGFLLGIFVLDRRIRSRHGGYRIW